MQRFLLPSRSLCVSVAQLTVHHLLLFLPVNILYLSVRWLFLGTATNQPPPNEKRRVSFFVSLGVSPCTLLFCVSTSPAPFNYANYRVRSGNYSNRKPFIQQYNSFKLTTVINHLLDVRGAFFIFSNTTTSLCVFLFCFRPRNVGGLEIKFLLHRFNLRITCKLCRGKKKKK